MGPATAEIRTADRQVDSPFRNFVTECLAQRARIRDEDR